MYVYEFSVSDIKNEFKGVQACSENSNTMIHYVSARVAIVQLDNHAVLSHALQVGRDT